MYRVQRVGLDIYIFSQIETEANLMKILKQLQASEKY